MAHGAKARNKPVAEYVPCQFGAPFDAGLQSLGWFAFAHEIPGDANPRAQSVAEHVFCNLRSPFTTGLRDFTCVVSHSAQHSHYSARMAHSLLSRIEMRAGHLPSLWAREQPSGLRHHRVGYGHCWAR